MKLLHRLPWYHGWNIVAAGMVAQAVIFGIALYSFTFWIAHWTADFNVSRAEAMGAFLVLQMGSALLSPFAGRALDKFSIRNLMLIAAVCFAAALALSSIASSLWQIMGIYGVFLVIGMVLGGTIPAAALVARWFDRRRGLAMGISTIGTSLGGFTLPPVVAYLQESYGWRDANLILALVSLILIGLAALVVSNSPAAAGIEHEGAKAVTPRADGTEPAVKRDTPPAEWTTAEALRSRVFWAIGLSFLALGFAFNAIQQNLGPIGKDAGMDPSTIAWFISIMALVMIGSKLSFGFLADRFAYRNVLTAVLAFIASALVILALFEVTKVTLLAAVIVLGIGMGGTLPLLGLIVAAAFGPASIGRIQGLIIFVMLPASLGAYAAASIFDLTGSYQYAWFALLALLAPAALFVRGIRTESSND